MSWLRTSKFARFFALLAFVVQLGVVAHHHHETLEAGGHAGAHGTALAAVHHDETHHDDHEQNDPHHGPDDDADHDCDVCVLKTAVGNLLLPDAAARIAARVPFKEIHFAASNADRPRGLAQHYQARAPPHETHIS